MNFTLKNKIKPKFNLYLFSFLFFFLITYFSIPKLLNFSVDSIKENLKNNNNININNISKVEYKVFPTPRLIIPNSNFTFGDGIVEVSNSQLEIILYISQILNSKKINYKKLLINEGSSKFDLNNISLLPTSINKIKKKINFKKNNLIFLQKNFFFLEINDTDINVDQDGEKKELNINGNFLKNKISIKLESKLNNQISLKLKIPELDVEASIFSKKNKSNIENGFFNLEVFNNFLKFNFTKEDNIKLTNGFVRSKILSSSIKGEVTFKPNFYSELDFKISNLNSKKLYPIVQKIFFSDSINNLNLIKKINGVYILKSKIEGKITSRNGEILLEEFKIGKNKSFYLNAKILEPGKKAKVEFNLITTVQHKRNVSKNIEIIGLLIPSNSSVSFKKFFLNGKELSVKKTKEYEIKFKDNVIQNFLGNIFNEVSVNKYFNNLF